MNSIDWGFIAIVFLLVYELEGVKDHLKDIKRRLDK